MLIFFRKLYNINLYEYMDVFAQSDDRGYGHGRFAGEFPVVQRQKEMRAQNLLNARQPACEHRRMLN
jgi:hypothetical protein